MQDCSLPLNPGQYGSTEALSVVLPEIPDIIGKLFFLLPYRNSEQYDIQLFACHDCDQFYVFLYIYTYVIN